MKTRELLVTVSPVFLDAANHRIQRLSPRASFFKAIHCGLPFERLAQLGLRIREVRPRCRCLPSTPAYGILNCNLDSGGRLSWHSSRAR